MKGKHPQRCVRARMHVRVTQWLHLEIDIDTAKIQKKYNFQ